jgi:transposase
VGAGTHLDSHTAAICDARGRAGSQLQVAAAADGYVQLLKWARREAAGRPVTWAIEGTRHYGLGLARYLASRGQQVAGIGATRHVGRRRAGKSDPIDAVRAARELLARPHRIDRILIAGDLGVRSARGNVRLPAVRQDIAGHSRTRTCRYPPDRPRPAARRPGFRYLLVGQPVGLAAKRAVWKGRSHGGEEGRDRRQEQGPLQAAP